jgi:O-antigen/teichoic acid export membrane protein
MTVDRELVLAVLSILGALSAASTLTWYISAYKNIEETRNRKKRGESIGLGGRVRLLVTVAGGISMFILYHEDPELFKPVISVAVVIFIIWLAVKRKPPF